ncbi:MAG: RNA polymerase sigma factor [Planctomycetota bacterium]|nr:MAG: RNA polymerase sigma factor [Planctomycetota bacterium]
MKSPADEEELVAKAVAGDRAALQGLLLMHYETIETTVRARFTKELAAQLEVDDLIQEVLVDVHRGIGSYASREGSSFKAWLRRVAENRIIDTVRRYQRLKRSGRRRRVDVHRPSSEMLDSVLEWIFTDSDPPDRPARHEEARQAIQVCIAGLKPEQRDAVTAHYFEHLDTSEIAERLGRSSGAVRELLRRARENLKSLLGSASAWLSSR